MLVSRRQLTVTAALDQFAQQPCRFVPSTTSTWRSTRDVAPAHGRYRRTAGATAATPARRPRRHERRAGGSRVGRPRLRLRPDLRALLDPPHTVLEGVDQRQSARREPERALFNHASSAARGAADGRCRPLIRLAELITEPDTDVGDRPHSGRGMIHPGASTAAPRSSTSPLPGSTSTTSTPTTSPDTITGGWCRRSTGTWSCRQPAQQLKTNALDRAGTDWAGFPSARPAFVMGDPLSTLRIVEDLGRASPRDRRPYADHPAGLETRLAASGRLDDPARLIDALEPARTAPPARWPRHGRRAPRRCAEWPVLGGCRPNPSFGLTPKRRPGELRPVPSAQSDGSCPSLGRARSSVSVPDVDARSAPPQLARTLADVAPSAT
jgi:hypothetical protein